jgi:hypothetical protein
MTSQYIITDEKLQQLLTRQRKNPLGSGHGSEFLSLADWEIATIVDEVYHHPYNPQAEREKVLNNILKSIDEMQPAVTTNAPEFNDGRDCAYNFVRRVIENERLCTL